MNDFAYILKGCPRGNVKVMGVIKIDPSLHVFNVGGISLVLEKEAIKAGWPFTEGSRKWLSCRRISEILEERQRSSIDLHAG